jgi:hypothetical protein
MQKSNLLLILGVGALVYGILYYFTKMDYNGLWLIFLPHEKVISIVTPLIGIGLIGFGFSVASNENKEEINESVENFKSKKDDAMEKF